MCIRDRMSKPVQVLCAVRESDELPMGRHRRNPHTFEITLGEHGDAAAIVQQFPVDTGRCAGSSGGMHLSLSGGWSLLSIDAYQAEATSAMNVVALMQLLCDAQRACPADEAGERLLRLCSLPIHVGIIIMEHVYFSAPGGFAVEFDAGQYKTLDRGHWGCPQTLEVSHAWRLDRSECGFVLGKATTTEIGIPGDVPCLQPSGRRLSRLLRLGSFPDFGQMLNKATEHGLEFSECEL
eukprot:TRINITY_DN41732_c0_g1_i1.p1 TRINITY_DN41732_c0_g1~~TRINITY_DN41732_c0_g1_i1.p1  ORF type:complete len:237 (+),score=44.90 TRINITY_DN41732_c0_g1_i1:46-756(+)